ncbi:MAG: hypothetical protein WCP31_08730 [Chloroflexales bacterium]
MLRSRIGAALSLACILLFAACSTPPPKDRPFQTTLLTSTPQPPQPTRWQPTPVGGYPAPSRQPTPSGVYPAPNANPTPTITPGSAVYPVPGAPPDLTATPDGGGS